MLPGSITNSVGIARQFSNLNGSSSCLYHSRGSMPSSTIWAKSLGLNYTPKKPRYRLNTRGERCQLVRASAKTEEAEIDTNSNSNSNDEGMVVEVCKNLLQRAAVWKKAEKYKEKGESFEGKVDAINSGGVVVQFDSLQGFLPYSQMNLIKDESRGVQELAKELIGSTLSLKIVEVNEEAKKLIFSEKQAIWAKLISQFKEGDVFEGRVSSVVDFGAFVDLRFPDGQYPIYGLVHISEISWDLVRDLRTYIKAGESVRVKVTRIDYKKSKIDLSIKQLQADPLFETLDTLMPPEERMSMGTSSDDVWVSSEPLPGLEQICQELRQEEGIIDVKLGRQALEKRVVSQDLELWLSNVPGEGGKFTLLARAGRQVQEVQLETSLDRERMKQAVKRVQARVP